MSLKKKKNIYFNILIASICFSKISIDIGFSLKPFMVVTLLGVLFFIKDFIKLDNYKVLLKKPDISLLIFFVLYCLSIIYADNVQVALRMFLGVGLIYLFYAINRIILEGFDFKESLDTVLKVLIIICIINLLYYLWGIKSLDFNYQRENIRSFGVMVERSRPRLIGFLSRDPNTAFFAMTPIVFLTITFFKNNYSKVLLVLSSIILLLTNSRGGLLGLIIALVIYFIFLNDSLNKKILAKLKGNNGKLFIVLLILGAALALFLLSKTTIFKRFLLIFADGGSGRSKLWMSGFKQLTKTPIIGVGIHNSALLYYNDNVSLAYLHNTHLDILVEIGLLGTLVYINYIKNYLLAFVNVLKTNKIYAFILGSVISLLIQMFFLSLILNEVYYLILLIGSASLSNQSDTETEGKDD